MSRATIALLLTLLLGASSASANDEWYVAAGKHCIKAADLADRVGIPAIADPGKFMDYNRFQGVYAGWHWSRKRPDGQMWVDVEWGRQFERFDFLGGPITHPARHLRYYSSEAFCETSINP